MTLWRAYRFLRTLIASFGSKGGLFHHTAKPGIFGPDRAISTVAPATATLDAACPGHYPPCSIFMPSGGIGTRPYYYQFDGNNMATPVVSGATATLLQQNPSLTPDQVKALLMKPAGQHLVPEQKGQVFGSNVVLGTNMV